MTLFIGLRAFTIPIVNNIRPILQKAPHVPLDLAESAQLRAMNPD
jgi:hypothetical protein